jgi:hypothetical protein
MIGVIHHLEQYTLWNTVAPGYIGFPGAPQYLGQHLPISLIGISRLYRRA